MESAIFSKIIEQGVLVVILCAVAFLLWQKMKAMERERIAREKLTDNERKEREKQAREDCQQENKKAVDRIQALEDRAYTDNKEERSGILRVLETNSRAFEKLADIEKSREDSGLHRALPKMKDLGEHG